jgi:integrase
VLKCRVAGWHRHFAGFRRAAPAWRQDHSDRRGGGCAATGSWKKLYFTRGVRVILGRYAEKSGLAHNMPLHRLRHFLFAWLKVQGVDDALIQPYSGHESRTSLEIDSRMALSNAQQPYDGVIDRFRV